jgi:S-DNA-T family DNA segregation ATPase FtsK/SpoIIIE
MATSKPRSNAKGMDEQQQLMVRRVAEAVFLLVMVAALYLAISLLSYSPSDPGWSREVATDQVRNLGGRFGAWLADLMLVLFGRMAYAAPVLIAMAGVRVLRERTNPAPLFEWAIRSGGLLLMVLSGCILFALTAPAEFERGGGVLGAVLATPMLSALGLTGTTLINLAIVLGAVTLFTGLSWIRVAEQTGAAVMNFGVWSLDALVRARDWFAGRRARAERVEVRKQDKVKRKGRAEIKIEKRVEPSISAKEEVKLAQQPLFKNLPQGGLPPLELLDEPPEREAGYSEETLKAMSRQVELKLADFGIEAEVVAVHPGPVVTRFELQPAPGIKGSQISNLSKDLARGLSVISVRVIDVIPGKSVIGLEIPNQNREMVTLREILSSEVYAKSNSALTLGLGKSISGRPEVADLARMPHLLVAGTTGSGKSVALNAMILSLLYKADPSEVRLIMIDPKMLELSVYDGVQHLLTPVVTDMKEAANALRWCVAEMERRYSVMSNLGVRNLGGYNRKVKEAIDKGAPIPHPGIHAEDLPEGEAVPTLDTLPQVVVIVDEFADLMMIVGKKIEQLIARLAQKARASGIHLILATQRPSVDVITGLIKANIPTRIAFQVSSRIDSRTILDQQGAEELLGHGDMLYLPPGSGMPERIHGAFVSDEEVVRVVNWLKQQGEPEYLEDVLSEYQSLGDGQSVGLTGLPESDGGSSDDEHYDRAVAFVLESRRASISSVQRHLRIGYNRAARLIEEMEAQGVVSPPEHNGQREVLAPAPPRRD